MIRQLKGFSLVPFLSSLGTGNKPGLNSSKWLVAPSKKALRFCVACMVMFLAIGSLQAQTGKFSLSGYVKDESNGEVLINATITIQPSGIAVMSNSYGYYSVTLPAG